MQTLSITHFNAHCIAVLNDVTTSGKTIILTQNGKPAVEIRPIEQQRTATLFGLTQGDVTILGDIVSPVVTATTWDVNQ